MSKRDHEVVEDYKKIFSGMFLRELPVSSPHLHPLEGEWYLFEKEDRVPVTHRLHPDGYLDGMNKGITLENMQKWGWTVTPLLIYKVDVDKLR